ncbi:hypothetical protein NPIL_570371 [Nephila pilipes]|uniref:Uncharacterized protein n=1 Tax=Nephila pilipes TaxID=299642 RepID=A0A8X6M8T5_NEPPI|nr:hypothetical protein NPIL_570371 [Nephila pilipes]
MLVLFANVVGSSRRLPSYLPFGRPSNAPSLSDEFVCTVQTCLKSVYCFARERINVVSGPAWTQHHCESRYTIIKSLSDVVVWIQKWPTSQPNVMSIE